MRYTEFQCCPPESSNLDLPPLNAKHCHQFSWGGTRELFLLLKWKRCQCQNQSHLTNHSFGAKTFICFKQIRELDTMFGFLFDLNKLSKTRYWFAKALKQTWARPNLGTRRACSKSWEHQEILFQREQRQNFKPSVTSTALYKHFPNVRLQSEFCWLSRWLWHRESTTFQSWKKSRTICVHSCLKTGCVGSLFHPLINLLHSRGITQSLLLSLLPRKQEKWRNSFL